MQLIASEHGCQRFKIRPQSGAELNTKQSINTAVNIPCKLCKGHTVYPSRYIKWRKVSTSADVFLWVFTSAYNKDVYSGQTLQ
jgi:hypothetical protein